MVARQVLSNADLHKKQKLLLPDLGDLPGMEDTVVQPAPATLAADVLDEAEVLPEPQKPADHFAPGATVAGRYRLEASIGQVGMAAVYPAFDLELEEKVALKAFAAAQTSETLLARFKQELE